MIVSLFRRSPASANRRIIETLYDQIVAAAREPLLYDRWGMPDTPLGRYESVSMHMIVFLHRTRGGGEAAKALEQELLDEFFRDIDHSIRELGVGDPSVPKRMKKLAKMFYGRMEAYWKAMDIDDREGLAQALSRNVDSEVSEGIDGPATATYLLAVRDDLARQADADILAGRVSFPSPRPEAATP